MITGEHAVVYGHPAIVAAIAQRITVQLVPRSDRVVSISSQIAPKQHISLADVAPEGPYRFVLAAVLAYRDQLATGLDITITSQIDPTLGLGSSAAVLVACLRGLAAVTQMPLDGLHGTALGIVQQLQGRGSGADLAASLHGGMISYQNGADMHQAVITPLPTPPQLSLCYVGYKTPTGEVLRRVAEACLGRETEFDALYAAMGATASQTIAAARAADWAQVGALLNAYQDHMRALGVSDDALERLLVGAHKTLNVLGAKISGSGLGDCVLALGTQPDGFTPAVIAPKGAFLHD